MLNKLLTAFGAKNYCVSSALKNIFSSELVHSFSKNIEEKYLIEAISRDRGIDEDILLKQIAEIVGIEAATKTLIKSATPSIKTENNSSASSDKLFNLGIVPCHTLNPPSVIISNPKSINVKEFQKANIKLYLALGKDTDKVWQDFFDKKNKSSEPPPLPPSLTFEVLSEVIFKIAKEAKELGGEEIILSMDGKNSYLFKANKEIYKGDLDSRVLRSAKGYLGDKKSLTLNSSNNNFSLELSKKSKDELLISMQSNNSSDKIFSKEFYNQKIIKVKSKRAAETPLLHNTVILVDDDPRFLKILSNIMQQKGWKVRTAACVKEALKLALDPKNPPCLLVSDINMPGTSGEEVLIKIKEALPGLPVIILTGEKDKKLESKLALLGADAFTRKQDDPSILISWCQAMVNKYQPNSANSTT